MTIHKAFNQKLYDANDPAKLKVLSFLNSTTNKTWEINPDQYGVDIVCTNPEDDGLKYIEVEVKHHWKPSDKYFPFPTLQIPERKSKWLDLPMEFWVLRSDRKLAIVASSAGLKKYAKLQVVRNKYVRDGEYFFVMPVGLCKVLEIKE
jgi:hypothetical protein